MITYWTFTGQLTLLALVFGMPLLYIVGTILIMMWLESSHGIYLQTLTVFISFVVMDLVVGGLGALRAHRKIKLSTSWIGSTLVIAGCSIAIAMPLIKDFTDRPMSQWGSARVMTPYEVNYGLGKELTPELQEGRIFLAYGASDASEIKSLVKADNKPSREPIDYLGPLMTEVDGLQLDVVDNQFRISGFDPDVDGLFLVVEGYVNFTASETKKLRDPLRRVFVHEFFDLSKADHERGHVDLPLNKGTHMLGTMHERLLQWEDSKKVHMQYVGEAI